MPEPRETLAYPAPLGQRVMLAPLALPERPELKVMLVPRVILEPPELPEQPDPLVVPDRLGPLALQVLTVRPEPRVAAC